ncbi:MAG: hypothetical protein M1826_004712 [Phylliscum demangeonii]|nr:MAG: hypothetical protein M1826_004712 [Phylliscum demangeonii]
MNSHSSSRQETATVASPGGQGFSSGRSKLERKVESAKEGWAKKIAVDQKAIKSRYKRKTVEVGAGCWLQEAGFQAMAALQAKLAAQMGKLWQQKAALEVACAEKVASSRAAVEEKIPTKIEKMQARAVPPVRNSNHLMKQEATEVLNGVGLAAPGPITSTAAPTKYTAEEIVWWRDHLRLKDLDQDEPYEPTAGLPWAGIKLRGHTFVGALEGYWEMWIRGPDGPLKMRDPRLEFIPRTEGEQPLELLLGEFSSRTEVQDVVSLSWDELRDCAWRGAQELAYYRAVDIFNEALKVEGYILE